MSTSPPLSEQGNTLPSPRKAKKSAPGASSSSGGSCKHPVYRGIRNRSGKWVTEVREPKKTTRIWLGTYPTPEMAAAAYDVAILALKGDNAKLNFPNDIPNYQIPSSPSTKDIRKAAADAAALKKPKREEEEELGPSEVQACTMSHDNWKNTESFMDEEEFFDMPSLLRGMAEGMLVSPPRMRAPPADDSPRNSDSEDLWSY